MMQHGGNHLVDTGRTDHRVGDDALDRAEDERAQLHGVDPEVEQRAAAELAGEVPVLGRDWTAEPEICLDQERLADATLADEIHQRTVGRQEPAPDRLHQEQSPAPRLLCHARRLPGVERERLLAQDVLPGPEGVEGVRLVARVRSGDVDDVHVRIGRQRVVVAVPGRNGEAVAEGLGPFGRTRGHGDDGAPVDQLHCLGEARGDRPRADEAPADHRRVLREWALSRWSMSPFHDQATTRRRASDNAIIACCLG